jgi:phage FluMu protein Com
MEDFAIKFRCKHCGQEIGVPEIHTGKNGKCPKCKNIVVVPKAENAAPAAGKSNFSDSEVSKKYSGLDHALFDIPPELPTANQQSSQDSVSEKGIEELEKADEGLGKDKTEQIGDRELPWIIDIFLYPVSFWGLVNLAIIIGVPELMDFLQKIMIIQLSCLFGLIALIIKVVVFLFMYWYFAECVRDSADGGLRAPNVRGDVPGALDMFLQMMNIIGCLLVFFMPFVIYVLIARRIDVIFWLLLLYAVFFFPMALLAIVVLDTPLGLNPRLIYNSISNTFRQYCGLVLLIVAAILLIGVLGQKAGESGNLAFFVRCASIYLVFVAAHLLGRFYWLYQEKLNWEV